MTAVPVPRPAAGLVQDGLSTKTATGSPSVSFEFFPPKTAKMEAALWQSIRRLAPIGPAFFSVTYGAGGSTRERTHATVTRLQAETRLPAAAHLTCVDATRETIDDIARHYWAGGIRHIVALRGDPPVAADGSGGLGGRGYIPTAGGYAFAADLVAGLRRIGDFEISVAAYPETHPEATSADADLDNLKRKVDAGASRAITQFFFDNAAYFRFLDRARAAGITVPIAPGILPITNFTKTVEFAGKCGAQVPRWFAETFVGLDSEPETRQLVAATVAARQCDELRRHGVDHFHFYTLNRAELTVAICHMLGLRGPVAAAA